MEQLSRISPQSIKSAIRRSASFLIALIAGGAVCPAQQFRMDTMTSAQAEEMISQQEKIERRLAEMAAQQKEAAAAAKTVEITRSIQEGARIESERTDKFWKERRELMAQTPTEDLGTYNFLGYASMPTGTQAPLPAATPYPGGFDPNQPWELDDPFGTATTWSEVVKMFNDGIPTKEGFSAGQVAEFQAKHEARAISEYLKVTTDPGATIDQIRKRIYEQPEIITSAWK